MGLRTLRIAIGVLGLVPIAIGASGMVNGLESLAPGAEISIGADGQYRYLSAVYLGFGCLLIWTQFRLDRQTELFRILMAMVFVAGVGRAIPILMAGGAELAMVVATAFELVAPPVFVVWHARVKG